MTEHTELYGKFQITLPIGLEYDPKSRRDDYASFLTPEKLFKEVRPHHIAMTTVLPEYISPRHTKRVLHVFGGLGATVQIIEQIAPKAKQTFWERSKTCCDYLRRNWSNVVWTPNSFLNLKHEDLSWYDTIIFDPSLGTILTEGVIDAWDYMSRYKIPLIWATDFAISKLHLNGKAYERVFGHPTFTFPEYVAGYEQFLRARGKRIMEVTANKMECYMAITSDGRKSQPVITEISNGNLSK